MKDKSEIGEHVQRAIQSRVKDSGLGPVALSQQTGLTRQTIHTISSNQGRPSIVTAWLLADHLGLTIDELVGRTERT